MLNRYYRTNSQLLFPERGQLVLVCFSPERDHFGLRSPGHTNEFGTDLMVSGTVNEVLNFCEQKGLSFVQ